MSVLNKVFFIVILITMLPCLSFGQMWLYNDNGNATSYWGDAYDDAQMATKFTAPTDSACVDSLIMQLYRPAGTEDLHFRIHLYNDDFTIQGEGCTPPEECDGPDVNNPVWSSDTLVSGPSYPDWVGFGIPSVIVGSPFICSIEIISGGHDPVTYGTTLLLDDGIPDCCLQYMLNPHLGFDQFVEHYSYFDPSAGHYMIRVHTGVGPPPSPCLIVDPNDIFYGHAIINWQGGAEPITEHNVELTNVGGYTDTILAITSTNPDFTWSGNPLPYYLYSWQSELIDITFQTTTPGERVGTLEITHTGQNCYGPSLTTIFTVNLSGNGFNGHWLENFYDCSEPDPICGPWFTQRDSCEDDDGWVFYVGGYADQDCMIGHEYTNPDCFVIDWLISSPLENPANAGVDVSWINLDVYPASYDFHGLYWTAPDCSYYYFVAEIAPTPASEWIEVGPYFMDAPSDSIQLAFLYLGAEGDSWYMDDIQVEAAPSNVTILYYPNTDDVSINWKSSGAPSYDISRSITDPFSGFSVIGSTADTFYYDAVGGNVKSFYRVAAQYDAPPLTGSPAAPNGEAFDLQRLPKVETNQVPVDCAVENANTKPRTDGLMKKVYQESR